MNINIPGIDIDKAIRNSGSEQLFTELLGDVYKILDDKCNLIETYLDERNIQNYTVEVHALKTTCRMIGAIDLGEDFYTLEKLGKENNLEQIEKLTPDVLNTFRSLKPYLEPFASSEDGLRQEFDKEAVTALLNNLITAIDDFNLGDAEAATKELSSYNCSSDLDARLKSLDKLVTNLDYDEAKELAAQIIDSL